MGLVFILYPTKKFLARFILEYLPGLKEPWVNIKEIGVLLEISPEEVFGQYCSMLELKTPFARFEVSGASKLYYRVALSDGTTDVVTVDGLSYKYEGSYLFGVPLNPSLIGTYTYLKKMQRNFWQKSNKILHRECAQPNTFSFNF